MSSRPPSLFHAFLHAPTAMVGAVLTLGFTMVALAAPWLASQDPFDPAQLQLFDAFLPPIWIEGGRAPYLLGSDDQGRDLASAILYGLRISLLVGLGAVVLAVLIGTTVGLIAGYRGGWADAVLMRIADVQLTIPAILVAFLVDGISRVLLTPDAHAAIAIWVLILAIGLADWPQYARIVRSETLVERSKDYVAAAKLAGTGTLPILARHILPNVLPSVIVVGTLGLALAVITEATLSFLGLGMPPTQPSLGTLIRIGNDFLFSGEWWIALGPAAALALLVLGVNLLGDWLREMLDPKARRGR